MGVRDIDAADLPDADMCIAEIVEELTAAGVELAAAASPPEGDWVAFPSRTLVPVPGLGPTTTPGDAARAWEGAAGVPAEPAALG